MTHAVVIPVRMVVGSRILQSTSRALDADGLFVRCVNPPLAGTPVSIRLYLPDGASEELECVVVPERELREVGCRVAFLVLPEALRARIVKLATPPTLSPAAKSTSKPPPFATAPRAPLARIELRALARVPAQIKVRFGSVDEAVERMTLDISAGGMFVRAEKPPLVGEEVTLLFGLPGEEEPLSCKALVVRRVAQEEARFTGQVAGAGVQFVDASDQFRERLDRWLANAQGLTPIE